MTKTLEFICLNISTSPIRYVACSLPWPSCRNVIFFTRARFVLSVSVCFFLYILLFFFSRVSVSVVRRSVFLSACMFACNSSLSAYSLLRLSVCLNFCVFTIGLYVRFFCLFTFQSIISTYLFRSQQLKRRKETNGNQRNVVKANNALLPSLKTTNQPKKLRLNNPPLKLIPRKYPRKYPRAIMS